MDRHSSVYPPWGKFRPRGMDRINLVLPATGLSHGYIKKWLRKCWLKRHQHDPVDITYHDINFRLHPQDNAIESKMLFASRQRDRKELSSLKKSIPKGGIFIDIGANIGYYSLMAARFGAGKVLAIEPNPDIFSRLKFNISINDFEDIITGIPLALGDRDGNATLYLSRDDLGGSSFISATGNENKISVKTSTLIEVLNQYEISHIDAMKIDVEGMEDRVLLPFFSHTDHKSLWPDMVIIEHTSQQHWQDDIVSRLSNLGYTELIQTRSNLILSWTG